MSYFNNCNTKILVVSLNRRDREDFNSTPYKSQCLNSKGFIIRHWLRLPGNSKAFIIRHWLRLPGLGNNNEKLGLPERLSAGTQFRFRNLFHGEISGNRNFIC